MKEVRDGNFECDKPSKQRIMQAMQQYFQSNCPHKFIYEIVKNPQADIDCYASAVTITNEVLATYAIECKERNKEYNELYCEEKKYNDLNNSNTTRKYVANLLPSGIYIWDLNTLDKDYYTYSWISKTTKGTTEKDKKKEYKKRILMPKNKSLRIK